MIATRACLSVSVMVIFPSCLSIFLPVLTEKGRKADKAEELPGANYRRPCEGVVVERSALRGAGCCACVVGQPRTPGRMPLVTHRRPLVRKFCGRVLRREPASDRSIEIFASIAVLLGWRVPTVSRQT